MGTPAPAHAMLVPRYVTRKVIERTLLRGMSGKTNDLERLLDVANRFADVGVRRFLKAFAQDSHQKAGFFQHSSDSEEKQAAGAKRSS